jgi:hypothetical protein
MMVRATNSTAVRASPLSGPQRSQLRMPPAVAIRDLEHPHRQPVALLEPVRVRERPRRRDLAQQRGLGARVDADLGKRPGGRLVRVTAQQLQRRRQLVGDLVQDQPLTCLLLPVPLRRAAAFHRRQR